MFLKLLTLRQNNPGPSGFSLIQISIILTLASLMMVATLPSSRTVLSANKRSAEKMNNVLLAVREYEATYGYVPCPADPNLAKGNGGYGVASTNSGSTNNCISGSIYAPSSSPNHVAIGMVPVKTLGLSSDDALDGFNRDITYAVDTGATSCWSAPSMQGSVVVNDNGVNQNTVLALVSHGTDGYGAWLPLAGTGSGASRLNSGSTNASQADNAQVAHNGGLSQNTTFASLVSNTITTIFDDTIAYQSSYFNLNILPLSITGLAISPPANGTYHPGQTWTFTLTTSAPVSITGTPYLQLTALSSGTLSAHANYVSASSTSTSLVFQYTIQPTDTALSGIQLGSSIVGTTVPCIAFTPPDLSKVIISPEYIYVADLAHNRVVKLTTGGSFVMALTQAGGNGALNTPTGVVLDNAHNIWVVDNGNNRIVEYNSSGVFQKVLTHSFSNYLQCIAYDSVHDTLWIADGANHLLQSYNNTTSSWGTTITLASGYTTFGVAVDSTGSYVWTSVPSKCTLEKCTTAGSCTTVPATPVCGTGAAPAMNGGSSDSDTMAMDPSNNVWVVDESNSRVEEFKSPAYNTYAKFNVPKVSASGSPTGIFFDVNDPNYIWIADESTNAIVKTLASDGTSSTSISSMTNAGGNTATFSYPQQIYLSNY